MIYDKIKLLCVNKRMSICTLEKKVGLSNGAVGKWRESSPSLDSLRKVAKYFDVPIEYFLQE